MTPEEIGILKSTIAKGCSDLELQLFLRVCDRTGLDPFAKQICPVMRWDKKENRNVMAIQVQVDGYRVLAQRTGEYGGSDRPLFDEGLTLYEHKQTKRGKPTTCTVTVYRINQGVRCPYTAEIAWDDFYPGDKLGFMWNNKPYQMLVKTVESQALRKAFQIELASLETPEELAIVEPPTPSQARNSPHWQEARSAMLNASTVMEVTNIAQQIKQRVPVGDHELNRTIDVAVERLEPVPAESAGRLIKECRTALNLDQSIVVQIMQDNNFDPAKVGEMTLDDAAKVIALIKAYVERQRVENLPMADRIRAQIKAKAGDAQALQTIKVQISMQAEALSPAITGALTDQVNSELKKLEVAA
jgi:phage recombination protein Bet